MSVVTGPYHVVRQRLSVAVGSGSFLLPEQYVGPRQTHREPELFFLTSCDVIFTSWTLKNPGMLEHSGEGSRTWRSRHNTKVCTNNKYNITFIRVQITNGLFGQMTLQCDTPWGETPTWCFKMHLLISVKMHEIHSLVIILIYCCDLCSNASDITIVLSR